MPQVDAHRLRGVGVAAHSASHRSNNKGALANTGVAVRNNRRVR
jgi:hypothetical protein